MTFCAVPEQAAADARERVCKWPTGHVIKVLIEQKLDEFTDDQYLDAVEDWFSPWSAYSGMRWEFVDRDPNVVILARNIDGPGGIVGEAELACGATATSVRRLWMCTGENWANATNPPARYLDVVEVGRHEVGHILGLGHETAEDALMNPTVGGNRRLRQPDIDEIVLRYGDPSATPPPEGGTPCDTLLRNCFANPAQRKNLIHAWELFKRAMVAGSELHERNNQDNDG